MSLWGDLGAGVGFLGVGVWQTYISLKSYRLSGKTASLSSGKVRYRQYAAVAVLAVLHIVFSLISAETRSHRNAPNGLDIGAAFAFERVGVAAVFLLYAVVAFVSEATTALPLPAGTADLLAVFAFAEEFALFYLTSGKDHAAGLEAQYYSLLLVPIGVCLLATAAEIGYPGANLPRFVQSLALILQGTWFFQIAVSVSSSIFMAKGCESVQQSQGVETVSCNSMSLMRGKALATLQFNCHLSLLLLILIPMYGLLSKAYAAPSNYERLGGNQVTEGTGELQGLRESGQELTQADVFRVLGEDDEEEDEGELALEVKEEVPHTNGFDRVAI